MNGGQSDALGLSLGEVDFAFVMQTDKLDASRSWVSPFATAGNAAFVGIDGITLAGDTITVEINRAAADGTLVDYLAASLEVTTGLSETITLNMDGSEGEIIKASGNLDINLFNFFAVKGGFAFEKYQGSVTLSDGEDVDVDFLTLGGANVDAFVGLNGNSPDAFGLELGGVNFALALISEQEGTRSWTSLEGDAASANFAGIDGLTLTATNIEVAINQSGNDDEIVVDYAAKSLEVANGFRPVHLLGNGRKQRELHPRRRHPRPQPFQLLLHQRRLCLCEVHRDRHPL